jgi:DNA-binding transcriptional LysR family regulator
LYPDIQLELTASEGFIDLIERKVDLAIRIGSLEDSSLNATPLGDSKLHMVASPSYLKRNGIPRDKIDLNSHTKIGFMHSERLNVWPVDGGQFFKPEIAVTSGELMRQLSIEGNGIACLSNFMVAEDIREGRLVKVLTNEQQLNNPRERVNAVYYRNTSLSSRIKAFLDYFNTKFRL